MTTTKREASNVMEKRNFTIERLKTRTLEDGSEIPVVEGYASVFNVQTDIGGWYIEEIAPEAFDKSLSEKKDVRALFNHNWDKVLGRISANTLRLSADTKGLKFEVDLPNTTYANDLKESMARGDVKECSFGFIITAEEWKWAEGEGKDLVRITEVDLYEISIVTLPQYEETTATLRSKENIEKIHLRNKILKRIGEIL